MSEGPASGEPVTTPANERNLQIIGYVLSLMLIATFLWRTLTTAREYPSRAAQMMEIFIDVLCVVGMFGVKSRIPVPLFWAGLILRRPRARHSPQRRCKLVDGPPDLFHRTLSL